MFKNMKIGMRLGIGFGVVVLTLILVALLSAMRLAEIGGTIDKMVNDRFP